MGDFGKGPALRKNDSGYGYHYHGAPGFESDPPLSGRMIRRVGAHPGITNVSGGEQSSSPSEIPRVRDDD